VLHQVLQLHQLQDHLQQGLILLQQLQDHLQQGLLLLHQVQDHLLKGGARVSIHTSQLVQMQVLAENLELDLLAIHMLVLAVHQMIVSCSLENL
jgi:hypothetical protein